MKPLVIKFSEMGESIAEIIESDFELLNIRIYNIDDFDSMDMLDSINELDSLNLSAYKKNLIINEDNYIVFTDDTHPDLKAQIFGDIMSNMESNVKTTFYRDEIPVVVKYLRSILERKISVLESYVEVVSFDSKLRDIFKSSEDFLPEKLKTTSVCSKISDFEDYLLELDNVLKTLR